VTDENLDDIPDWLRRRGEAFARHPLVRRPVLRRRFARFAGARPGASVVDVGCGAGHNAFALGRTASRVTAVDWRPYLLEQASRQAARQRHSNVRVIHAQPHDLPFGEGEFDVVTSAAAMHHFPAAEAAFAEMSRVCRPGGVVALEDVVTSEQEVRARYHNRLERLRDRSHQRCLPLSQIVAGLGRAGLLVRRIEVHDSLREFSEWLAVTGPPPRRSDHIRHLLLGSVDRDLSGLNVQPEDDTFLFVQQVAWVVAVKPDDAQGGGRLCAPARGKLR
jgi:SAM-dependent methyltransferase